MKDAQNSSYLKVLASLLLSLFATAVVIYLGFKCLYFFMPFVIAWIIAMAVSPMVKWLENRLNVVRKLGSAITIVLVIGLIVIGIYAVLVEVWELVTRYISDLPDLYQTISVEMEYVVSKLNIFFEKLPQPVESVWDTLISELGLVIGDIISKLSLPTMSAAGSFAKAIPNILVSAILSIIATYFFVSDREEIIKWVSKVTPAPIEERMKLVNYHFKYAIGGYFKAQLKIMVIVFIMIFISLALLGVNYAILVALGIAILDFFPVFGTGTALIPWALFRVVLGDYKLALFLIVIYIATQGLRQFIQPKLVADSVNMNPVVALLLLYAGYKIASVIGMIIAVPIGLIAINLYEAGAMDYILNDVKILRNGILELSKEWKKFQ